MDKRDTTTATSRVRHRMSRRRLSPPRHPTARTSYPSVQIFFPGWVWVQWEMCLPSLFHIKEKKGKDNSEGREITSGGNLREYAALKPTNMVEEPERGESFFTHFFVVTLPSPIHFCTPCGHCRRGVTRSRDWAVSTVLRLVLQIINAPRLLNVLTYCSFQIR